MSNCKFGSRCYLEKNGVDEENYTVPVILSDETEVKRFSWEDGEYMLTLEHTEKAIDLERAEILSMFVNHDTSELPLAVFTDVRVEDNKLKANAVFDKDDEESLKIFKKIAKGFLKSFSIGAEIYEKTLEKEIDGVKYYKATRWGIYECSLVGIPAIPNAKVGLEKETVAIPTANGDKIANFTKGDTQMEFSKENFEALKLEKESLEAELANKTAEVEAKREELSKFEAEKAELSRKITEKKEIVGLAYQFGMSKDDAIALMDSESLSQANTKVLELFKSNGITLKGDVSEETFEENKDNKSDSKELWSKIRNKG